MNITKKNSYEFSPLEVTIYHIFSSIKIGKYMESELFGIFWVKLVAKNIVRRSPGNHFMYMRVKETSDYSYFVNTIWNTYSWLLWPASLAGTFSISFINLFQIKLLCFSSPNEKITIKMCFLFLWFYSRSYIVYLLLCRPHLFCNDF